MNEFIFVINNFLAFLSAALAADMLFRDREPERRFLATVAGFPIVTLITMLLLGTFGFLTAGSTAISLSLFTSFLLVIRKTTRPVSNNSTLIPKISPETPFQIIGKAVLIVILGGAAGLFFGFILLRGTKFCFDDLSYHAPAVAHWIIDESLSLAPFNYHAHYPFNAELLSLWFILPFHADGLASLAGIYWLGLTAASVASFGLSQKYHKWTIFICCILATSSLVVQYWARSFSGVDLAGPAILLSALFFASENKDKVSYKGRLADAAYCGLLTGYAVGTKISFAPVLILLCLWFALGRKHTFKPIIRIHSVGVFILGACATGTFWYIRNWILTGNPLFPAETGPFEGPLSTATMNSTKFISHLPELLHNKQWISIAQMATNWPIPYFLLCATGYLSGFYYFTRFLFLPGKSWLNTKILLFLIGITLLLLHPFMPFSGTTNSPNAPLQIFPRYLICPFLIGIILFMPLIDSKGIRGRFWQISAILATLLLIDNYGNFHLENAAADAILIGAGFTAIFLWKKIVPSVSADRSRNSQSGHLLFQGRLQWNILLFFVPAMLVTFSFCVPFQQQLTNNRIYSYGSKDKPIGAVWQALEKLPDGSHIAWFGPTMYQYYPVFGRKFQFTPCSVCPNGKLRVPLYRLWKNDRENIGWWKNKKKRNIFKPDSLCKNLAAAKIDYVLVSKWQLDQWPAQQKALADSGKYKKLYDDGYSAIWHIID